MKPLLARFGRRARWRRRFRDARGRCRESAVCAWLEAAEALAPGAVADTDLLSVDLELTGLEPRTARIVSIGWTVIAGGRIRFAENRHVLVNPGRDVGASAVVHELRDRDVAEGVTENAALEALFAAATGKLFLFHHAPLDAACLQRAVFDWAGCRPPIPAVDTLQLEAERRRRRGQVSRSGDLRLGALREAYGLPPHALHDALGDAMATAELFLAMTSQAQGGPVHLDPLTRLL